jgi:outer membrane receptor for ferrienterochelin and colicin
LKNIFSRYDDNQNKTGVLFRNDSKEQEIKLRVHVTNYIRNWKLSYGANLQNSVYTNNTVNLLDNFLYETKIDFTKIGFFGKISGSLLNDRLSLALGLRSDADSFTEGSDLKDNISPRLSASYALKEDNRWKVNASVGRYFKIPIYTMLGFQDNSGAFINKVNRYTQSDHYVIGLEFNPSPSSRFTLEAFNKNYSQYPVSILDGVSLANKGGGFEVLGNEPVSDLGSGKSSGFELLFQQKLSKNFYGILAYTYFKSEFSGTQNIKLPSVWDSRNLISFTGGYKLRKNWEVSVRYRYAGKTPYVPVDTEESLAAYPRIILDYNRLGEEKLTAFSQGDIRIDKKWNFKKLSFNFYLEIQNFLAQENPRPDEYGLARNDDGSLITPETLVKIDTDQSNTPFPSFGFVFDF